MREFDDAAFLASNTPRAQLPEVISNMQDIRRAAEDQVVPSCLANLKQLQVAHMDTTINTLIAFLGGADQTALSQGTELARQQHNQYALEYARLLGLTVIAPVTVTAAAQVQDTPQPAATSVALSAFNPGPANVDIYAAPESNGPVILILPPGQSLPVVSQSADGKWIQVAIPGQPDQAAWVSTALVTLNPTGMP